MSKQKTQPLLSPEKYIRTRARSLPLGPCYINEDWQESGINMIIVTRTHSNKNITHAVFIVDMYCLGVKEAFWIFNQNPLDFKSFLDHQIKGIDNEFSVFKTNYTLVHNIIYGAIAFAEEYGFHPHKDFEIAQFVLEEDDDRINLINLEFGYKGKPLYVTGPENTAESRRVKAHLDKRMGNGNYYFIKEEDLDDFFEGKNIPGVTNPGKKAVNNEVDFHDPWKKKQFIKNFLSYEKKPVKTIEDPSQYAEHISTDSNIIFYKYILSADDIRKASDTISNIFDFKITPQVFSNEMLFGNAPPVYPPEEIRDLAAKIHDLAVEKNYKQMQIEVDAAMKKYPGIPVFQYFHLRLLQVKKSPKTFYRQVVNYLAKNTSYYPFVIMTAIDFLANNTEKTHRTVSEGINLRNFFPERTSFCREEANLNIQVLTLDYIINGKFDLLETMYHYLDEKYPGLIPKEKIQLMMVIKISYVMGWCRDWVEQNS